MTSTLELSAILLMWKSDTSALFAKTFEATKTLVCAFVLSKLDYCNSLLLSGCPLYLLSNCAMKLVFTARKH